MVVRWFEWATFTLWKHWKLYKWCCDKGPRRFYCQCEQNKNEINHEHQNHFPRTHTRAHTHTHMLYHPYKLRHNADYTQQQQQKQGQRHNRNGDGNDFDHTFISIVLIRFCCCLWFEYVLLCTRIKYKGIYCGFNYVRVVYVCTTVHIICSVLMNISIKRVKWIWQSFWDAYKRLYRIHITHSLIHLCATSLTHL